jgi:flagellar protein FlaD
MDEEDIKKVIRIDEDAEEENKKEPEKLAEKTPTRDRGESLEEVESKGYLTPEEIEQKVEALRGKLPSFLLRDLKESLSTRILTEAQLNEVINRALRKFQDADQGRKIRELSSKIDQLSNTLEKSLSRISEPPREIAKPEPEVEKLPKAGEKMEKVEEVIKGVEPGIVNRHVLAPSYPTEARLQKLPKDVEGIMLALKWVEFLIEKVGHSGLEDVLEYYVDIEWITDEVLSKLIRLARGIKPYHEESDWRPAGYLTALDHIQSLLYIEKLRGARLDKDLIDQLDREISRIKRRSEELHGI